MKLKSLFMFSAAALTLAACSNDEDAMGGATIDGEAAISVKINDPAMSRAVADYTNNTAVQLNRIRLVLTAQQGGDEADFNISDYQNDRQKLLDAVKAYQFTGVRNPSKMEVFINTEKSENWSPEDFMNAGLAEPLYASATASEFNKVDDPDTDKVTEYEVALTPAHTMARLELGGIAHVATKENEVEKPCMFETITIDGVMLDGVSGVAQAEAWDPTNLMSNAIGEEGESFDEATESNGVWTPSWPVTEEGAAQCYAYNIAPVTSGELPILKVCFSDITINTTDYNGTIWPDNGLGYATVKNYKLSNESSSYAEAFGVNEEGNITKFPAGYIYQVKSLHIPDEAIGQGWNGAEDVHVYAVITVSPWTIAQGEVEWN